MLPKVITRCGNCVHIATHPSRPWLTEPVTSSEIGFREARAAHLRRALGLRIITHRKRLELSQEDLGRAAEMHRTYIGSVERGERNVSLENLDRLSAALGMSIAELLSDL